MLKHPETILLTLSATILALFVLQLFNTCSSGVEMTVLEQ